MKKQMNKQEKSEEIRIIAFGPISQYLNSATLPAMLNFKSRKVARIGLGEDHAVFLFIGFEVAVSGKNDRGQLGIPINDEGTNKEYNGLVLHDHERFIEEKRRVIDVAAGINHTMFLTEPTQPDPESKEDPRKVYVCGARDMLGKFSTKDAFEPKPVEIERLSEDPELKIKYIFSANEK